MTSHTPSREFDRQMLEDLLASRAGSTRRGPKTRHGDDIFSDGDYPRTWDEFVGQPQAVAQLKGTITSARTRDARLEHVLLASGMGGIGKTSLAKLIASEMGVGIVEISGRVTVDEARTTLRGMRDDDVLFYDEIHQAAGGRSGGEWLLHLLQDGGLMTAKGFEPMPKVTVVGATTDAQRLPQTILGRFMVRPVLTRYTDEQALAIAGALAVRMGLNGQRKRTLTAVAVASNNSPRHMKALLVALRDSYYIAEKYDLDLALTWAGVTFDGLDQLAQDFLCALAACGGKASLATVASLLNEPGPLRHTEQLLQQKGYVMIEPGGRALTESGLDRVVELAGGPT